MQSHSLGSSKAIASAWPQNAFSAASQVILSRRRCGLLIPKRAYAHAAFNLVSLKNR
jgi:hypothetical protein